MIPKHLEEYAGNLRDPRRAGGLPKTAVFIPLKSEDYEMGGDMDLSPKGFASAAFAGKSLSEILPSADGVKFSFTNCPSATRFAFSVAEAAGWNSSGELFLFLPGTFTAGINGAARGHDEVAKDCTGASAITELVCKAATLDAPPRVIVFFGTHDQCYMMARSVCLMLEISDDGIFAIQKNQLLERAIIDIEGKKSTFTYVAMAESL